MEREHSVLIGVDTYSLYQFAFPECNAFAKTTIYELTEWFIYHLGIPHKTDSDLGTHFTSQQRSAVGPRSWNLLLLPHFPPS